MAKDKIEVGEPVRRKTVLWVPVVFNFPDGHVYDGAYNFSWGKSVDDIEFELKQIYQDMWRKRNNPVDYSGLRGKKIAKVTGFDDEPDLPE